MASTVRASLLQRSYKLIIRKPVPYNKPYYKACYKKRVALSWLDPLLLLAYYKGLIMSLLQDGIFLSQPL